MCQSCVTSERMPAEYQAAPLLLRPCKQCFGWYVARPVQKPAMCRLQKITLISWTDIAWHTHTARLGNAINQLRTN